MNNKKIAERVVGAGFGSGHIGIYKSEVVNIIQDRIGGLCADHKTFLYIRLHNLHKRHNIGGGNITSALAAFSALSLLIKICYFIDKPKKFNPDPDYYFKTNETNAFCHLIKLLADNGVNLGVNKTEHKAQKLIWSGFRDYLAHLGTAEHGKEVVTFELAEPIGPDGVVDVDEKISEMLEWRAFRDDGSGRNWQVRIDTLFAKMEKEIVPMVVDKVVNYKTSEQSARDLYKLVSGHRDLP